MEKFHQILGFCGLNDSLLYGRVSSSYGSIFMKKMYTVCFLMEIHIAIFIFFLWPKLTLNFEWLPDLIKLCTVLYRIYNHVGNTQCRLFGLVTPAR